MAARDSRRGAVLASLFLACAVALTLVQWVLPPPPVGRAVTDGVAAAVEGAALHCPSAPPRELHPAQPPSLLLQQATAPDDTDADDEAAIAAEWAPIVSDWLRPWDTTTNTSGGGGGGIDEALIKRILALRPPHAEAMHVLLQHVGGGLYVVDPFKHCACGHTALAGVHWPFIGRRCRAFLSLLADAAAAAAARGAPLPPFDAVLDVSDLPRLLEAPFAAWPLREGGGPWPVFGTVRCWPAGGLSVPMPGSHREINVSDMDGEWAGYTAGDGVVPFADRAGVAVFRGGLRGCSPRRDVFAPHVPHWRRNRTACGRGALAGVVAAHPAEVDFTPVRLPMANQSRTYRYVVYAEGWGGWADRLAELAASGMVPMVQETPCVLRPVTAAARGRVAMGARPREHACSTTLLLPLPNDPCACTAATCGTRTSCCRGVTSSRWTPILPTCRGACGGPTRTRAGWRPSRTPLWRCTVATCAAAARAHTCARCLPRTPRGWRTRRGCCRARCR